MHQGVTEGGRQTILASSWFVAMREKEVNFWVLRGFLSLEVNGRSELLKEK